MCKQIEAYRQALSPAVDDIPVLSEEEVKKRRKILKQTQVPAILDLDEDELNGLTRAMRRQELVDGDSLGSVEDFYIVEQGSFECTYRSSSKRAEFIKFDHPGDHFSSKLATDNDDEVYTLQKVTCCEAPGLIWVVPKQVYLDSLHSQVQSHRDRLEEKLRNLTFLSSLSPFQKLLLADSAQLRTLNKYDSIIMHGQVSPSFHIVLEGEAILLDESGNSIAKIFTKQDTLGGSSKPMPGQVNASTKLSLLTFAKSSIGYKRFIEPILQAFEPTAKKETLPVTPLSFEVKKIDEEDSKGFTARLFGGFSSRPQPEEDAPLLAPYPPAADKINNEI